MKFNEEDFKRFYWFTPYQRRDMLLEEVIFSKCNDLNKEIQHIANLGRNEQTRRKGLPNEFVECPYCKGYHDQTENNDHLCESCEWTIHILNWDKEFKLKYE